MKIPQLEKKPELKSCHNKTWEDNYSWIHQSNILDVLKDSSKLLPETRKYLEKENNYFEHKMKDTKEVQKKIFNEIKGRIKLDDESLPYKDKIYEYWTKTTTKGNYTIKLRKKIGTEEVEEIWNGDLEKEKLKTEYFGLGDLEVSYNDKYLGYSLDLKGSEYYTIYIRDIKSNELVTEKIEETSGSITFSLDDKFIYYSKLDKHHRPRKIFRHKLGTSVKDDLLIFEEKSEAFTVGIGLSSDEKYFFIVTSDHNTSEQYYFNVDEEYPKPKIIKRRKRGIIYSVNSWDGYFYNHTNEDAEDFKIEICDDILNQNWKSFIPAKDEVLIGGLVFLKDWIIRSETSNALSKLVIRNPKTGEENELNFVDEEVIVPGIALKQRDKNTDEVYLSYSSPKTPGKSFLYNLKTNEKKLVKEQEIPSGHNSEDYIVERLECPSHDGRLVPLTITRHKKTKIDGNANLLLYGYGSYGNSMSPVFSSTRLSLIDRNIIWVTAHIRGGMERGMKWWKEGKLLNKKNYFGEPIADLFVQSSNLKGINVPMKWITNSIDELVACSLAFGLAKGYSKFTAQEMLIKESNRIKSVSQVLNKLGIKTKIIKKSTLKIWGDPNLKINSKKTIRLFSNLDHRIAMISFVAGQVTGNKILIKGFETVSSSFPNFLKIQKKIGAKYEIK